MSDKIEINDIKDSQDEYVLRMICSETGCEQVLAETNPMTGQSLYENWASLIMSAGFNTRDCPNKEHHPTFSDLNIHSESQILTLEDAQANPVEE
jgi:hypothetical protein